MLSSDKITPEPILKLGCHRKVSHRSLDQSALGFQLRIVGIKRRLEFRLDLLVEQP
jgi:hypothetical protein